MNRISKNRPAVILQAIGGVLILLAVLLTQSVSGQVVTLAWDPNPEPGVAGYRIYHGVVNDGFTNVMDVGNSLTNSVGPIAAGEENFFFVTAYDSSGLESEPSETLTYTPPVNKAPEVAVNSDFIVFAPAVVNLAAAISDDYTDESEVKVYWQMVRGLASTAAIGSPESSSTEVTISEKGDYEFEVFVSDGKHVVSKRVNIVAFDANPGQIGGTEFPQVSDIQVDLNGFTITWPSDIGSTYLVGYKETLNDPYWTVMETDILSEGDFTSWTDVQGAVNSQRYYGIFSRE